ncbi:A24 family peptidase [uncultured Algimonas sp.]|uniref:prepilin peptidase n=1 Tax=uncultured Algimonas sp. TaxID=1547920 RepID=UPI00261B5949|nr:A24 family peptidase [uncultured Algimonas sp.]
MTIITILAGLVLIGALIQLARIDWATQRLPNLITIPLLLAGLAWAFGTADDVYLHLLGAALGYGIFWAVETIYRLVRKRDGLGRGDAKLLAVGGAWCGAWALPAIILAASVSALVYALPKGGARDARIPFGPFLAIGIGAVWLSQRLF